jgi:hypothetical protein
MDVPVENGADPVLPTETLIPAGLEVILSPLRPVAVTVSVAVWAGGVTVSVAVLVIPPAAAVIVTGVDAATAAVVIVNVALALPAVIVTLAGTAAMPALPLVSVTANPPVGAADVSVTVPWDDAPPTMLVGLTDNAERDGAPAEACGVKLRVEENGPFVPAALTARTRHQSWRLGRVPAVNCDAVTVVLITNGEDMVLESSIWMLYDAAPVTSLQSKVTGCAGVAPLAGLRSAGADSRITVSPADFVTPP